MEERNIKLTLEKAKEWYNSDSKELKEVALQAFTKEELTKEPWERIKTFEDACKSLGIDSSSLNLFGGFSQDIRDHLLAVYKLDTIRRALNGDWRPKLTEGKVYYPYVAIYKESEDINPNGARSRICFTTNGCKRWKLVGGAYSYCDDGVGSFGVGYGSVSAYAGLLCCKSIEIAKHMSLYFPKEIFEACYSHLGLVISWDKQVML
jgi:hypothetical protein